jgi:hypothetical protein
MSAVLREMYMKGFFPSIQRLFVIDHQFADTVASSDSENGYMSHMFTNYSAFNRRDIIANRTLCMPYADLWNSLMIPLGWHIRPKVDEPDVITSKELLLAVAEDYAWCETTNGFRFPVSFVLPTEHDLGGYVLKDLEFLTPEQWKERNPKKGVHL